MTGCSIKIESEASAALKSVHVIVEWSKRRDGEDKRLTFGQLSNRAQDDILCPTSSCSPSPTRPPQQSAISHLLLLRETFMRHLINNLLRRLTTRIKRRVKSTKCTFIKKLLSSQPTAFRCKAKKRSKESFT